MDNEYVGKKRGPGRPKGSRTGASKKGEPLSLTQIRKLYDSIEYMLTEEQRAYYRDAFSGKRVLDPIQEGELFLRLLGLYVTEVIQWGIANKAVTVDAAQLIAQYRMGIKDLEDMKRRREEWSQKNNADGRVVDPTSESASRNLEDILGKYTPSGKG